MFDQRVVEAFKRSVVHFSNGTIVLLSDGRRGIVAKQNMNNSARPYIRIFEEDNMMLKSTYIISLEEYPELSVNKIETEYISHVE